MLRFFITLNPEPLVVQGSTWPTHCFLGARSKLPKIYADQQWSRGKGQSSCSSGMGEDHEHGQWLRCGRCVFLFPLDLAPGTKREIVVWQLVQACRKSADLGGPLFKRPLPRRASKQ